MPETRELVNQIKHSKAYCTLTCYQPRPPLHLAR